MLKAQIEFFTILGVVAIIVVVAYYALVISNQPSNPVPAGTGSEQSLVQDKIEGVISDGASLSIKWMESQGGSILPIFNDSVSFTRVLVPYWQKCGKTNVPSLEILTEELENATYNYIVYSMRNGSEKVLGKNVTADLSKLSVKANILDNQIDLVVDLPTTVQGAPIQQPYKTTIPTKFGEIYKFMKSYAEESARNRYLELFIINSIYFSANRADGGMEHPELPTFGFLTECGETITRTPEELSLSMEKTIFYTLANVKWWAKAATGLDCSNCGSGACPAGCSLPKTYTIESLNGRTYPQLNPLFLVDDNFGINITSGIYISNPKPVAKANLIFKQFVTSGWCMRPYSASYSFQTPVVLKVEDPLTNTPFNIATLVEINDLLPGNCGELPDSQSCIYNPGNPTNPSNIKCVGGEAKLPACGNCSVKMKVAKPDGSPAPGALGYFGDCTFLPSDSKGLFQGSVGCGADDLYITYIPASRRPVLYQRQWCGVSPEKLNGTVVMYEYPKLKIHFREVNLTTCKAAVTRSFVLANTSAEGACSQSITNANSTEDTFCTDEESCLRQLESATAEESVGFDALQPGTHNLTATLLSIEGSNKNETGGLEGSFNMTTQDRDIYMYVPLYKNASQASQEYSLNMTNLMISNCSINPVMKVDKA